jgi:hypothetical protein
MKRVDEVQTDERYDFYAHDVAKKGFRQVEHTSTIQTMANVTASYPTG